ncbi:nitrate- and nitrite sensing domain-containing protein [Nocardia sp. NPDC059246]|uniref:sensor histidine kinase n=1 Tax=unclassified Nocardia TaxID=2637762 RepID=UPI003693489E
MTWLRRHADGVWVPDWKTNARIGVRGRLLAIVLVSSVTLLAIGVGGSAYLVKTAREANNWAEVASSLTDPALAMIEAFQDERLQSLRYLSGETNMLADLTPIRKRTDAAVVQVQRLLEVAQGLNQDDSAGELSGYGALYEQLPVLRSAIDSHQVSTEQVFERFGKVIDTASSASMLAARTAPDAAVAVELYKAVPPLRGAEALSHAVALGSLFLVGGRPDARQLTEFAHYVGEYRGEAAYSVSVLRGERLAQLQSITAGSDWQLLAAMEETIMQRGAASADSRDTPRAPRAEDSHPADTALPTDAAGWQDAGTRMRSALMKLWQDQIRDAHAQARVQGERKATNSLYAGIAVLLVAVLAFLIALAMANRVVARMHRLHRHTLDLADHRLPDLMRRLGAGETVDPAEEVTGPEFGTDEIGHVAAAFNRAHLAALSAAVSESKTRAGVNAVFLNIAHRSQIVVHQQLALLDEAERGEEDPAHLDLLFNLDHLATRARRNAENLIVLGGGQPGRRWRNPVPLVDVVRGALAESLDYTRIRTDRMPEVRVVGKAVADLIHAMAELMDNATAFSPPHTPVAVSGTVVGRGVVIEIEDQGLGMGAEELVERNRALTEPPDFSVAALSGDVRLGLFVVAKLAVKHGISVRLGESMYGGVRAVLLIPSTLLADFDEADSVTTDSTADSAKVGAVLTPLLLPEATSSVIEPVEHQLPIPILPAPDVAQVFSDNQRPALPRRGRHSGPVEAGHRQVEPLRQRSADEAHDRIAAVLNASRKGRARPGR